MSSNIAVDVFNNVDGTRKMGYNKDVDRRKCIGL